MPYSMYDARGRGDSGNMSTALWPANGPNDDPDKAIEVEHDARPRVGVAMRVGSLFARSYHAQDWWQTTLIEEILEDTPNKVVFKTKSGSIYTWEVI